jgi:hypothetical protein
MIVRRVSRPFVVRLLVGLLVVVGIAVVNPSFVGWGLAVTAAVVASYVALPLYA